MQALYLRLKLPQPPEKAEGKWILIWSGVSFRLVVTYKECISLTLRLAIYQSTAVGQYAIQLAKLSGLKVATTASPSRWETLKAYGADLIVDYKVFIRCEVVWCNMYVKNQKGPRCGQEAQGGYE